MKSAKPNLSVVRFSIFALLLISSNVMSMNLSQLLQQQRNRDAGPRNMNVARRALSDLKDLENILLDADVGDDADDDYEDNTEVEDYDPLARTKKNYRRQNYYLGHMARMNFRRRNQRSSYGVGGDIRPGR